MTVRRRVVAVLVATVAALFLGATSASAANGDGLFDHFWDLPGTNVQRDCTRPPMPESPNGGLAGFFDPGPDKPVTGDPWVAAAAAPKAPVVVGPDGVWKTPAAPAARPSIYDVYGLAGASIPLYDPTVGYITNCASADSTLGPVNTIANFGVGIMTVVIAAAVRLFRLVLDPNFAALFNPFQALATFITGNGLLLPLMSTVIILAGVYFLWHSDKSRVSFVAEKASFTLLIITAGVIAMNSVVIGVNADKALGQVITTASSLATPDDGRHTAADSLGGALVASVLYSTWEQATFGYGPQNVAAAKKYGPDLYRASAFTRTEQARIEADPSLTADLVAQKAQNYRDAAAKVEKEFPLAFAYMRGDHVGVQAGFVFVGVVGALIAAGFLILALTRFGYAMVIVRVALGAAPALALVSAFPTYQYLFVAAFKLVWKAILNAVYFGVGVIVFIVAGVGGILNPDNNVDPVLKLIGLLVLTYVLVRGAREFGLLTAEEKAAQRLKDAAKRRHRSEDGSADEPAPSFEPERSYPMHAEFLHRPARGAVRAVGGAARMGALTAATVVTGGAAGGAAARQVTAAAARTGARQVGAKSTTVAARQITSTPSKRLAAGPASGQSIYHPAKPGATPPGPAKAATASKGVYTIHSISGGKR